MKLVRSKSGSKFVITKKEWEDIGTEQEWMPVLSKVNPMLGRLKAAETEDELNKHGKSE